MRKKVKKYSEITDSPLGGLVKKVVPAQIRTFVSTLTGNREPITEKNFTEKELQQARDAIARSRADPNFGPRDETVGYGHYGLEETRSHDSSLLPIGAVFNTLKPSEAMFNTLGRFKYEKTPEGKLVAIDNYDFKDDLVPSGHEGGIRRSSEYKDMSTLKKLRTLAEDTFSKGQRGDFPTLPSRVGSAFIGDSKRPVRIDLGDAPYKKGGVIRGGGIERKGKTKGRFV